MGKVHKLDMFVAEWETESCRSPIMPQTWHVSGIMGDQESSVSHYTGVAHCICKIGVPVRGFVCDLVVFLPFLVFTLWNGPYNRLCTCF